MTIADKSSSERAHTIVAPPLSPVLDLLLFALFSILVSISASSEFATLKATERSVLLRTSFSARQENI